MAKNKTQPTKVSVASVLNGIENNQQKKDAKAIDKMLRKVTGLKPKMWGSSIIGYGTYHYVYDSGREGDSARIGFSPRKQNIAIYIMPGFNGMSGRLKKLGKHKIGRSCLYINKLEDLDLTVLEDILKKSFTIMAKKYPEK